MQERPAAFQFVLEIRQLAAAFTGIFVILAAHRERDAVAGRHDDRGRPDFHLQLDRLARRQRLRFVMRVVGPVRLAQCRVQLAVRGPQPALADRRMRVDRALEHHFPAIRRVDTEHDEDIGVRGIRRNPQRDRRRPGDLGFRGKRLRGKDKAVAKRVEIDGAAGNRRPAQAHTARVGIELRPLGAGDRPLVLGPLDEFARPAHLQQHRRLPVPAIVLALEEMREEALLQIDAVIGIEFGPVLDAVNLQPFPLRGGAHETFDIAAQMQPLPAPVARGQHGHRDPVPHRRAVPVIVVVERVSEDIAAQIAPVFRQLIVRQGLIPAYRPAGDPAHRALFAAAVLHRLDLHVVPVFPERADDAAMVRHVAVPVGGALPDAHRGEVRRLHRGDVPLVDRVVGNAGQADLAVAPGLRRRPFDTVVKILRLAWREMIDKTRRAAAAARIDAHADITVRHPFFRVGDFPVLVGVGRAGGDVRVLPGHPAPGARIAVLEGEPLGVGPVRQDHRIAALADRPVDVGQQHQAVIHPDGNIPVDPHAVADFADDFAHCPALPFFLSGGGWSRFPPPCCRPVAGPWTPRKTGASPVSGSPRFPRLRSW